MECKSHQASTKARYLPVHGRAYPVPMVHNDFFQKKVNRLEKLGVFEQEPKIRMGFSYVKIPKNNGTKRYLTDFREVNKRLV